MNTRVLGRTELPVGVVGVGTMSFVGVYGSMGPAEAKAVVRCALDAGATFFDTSPMYGRAEEPGVAETILGEALKGERDKVVIASKFGRLPDWDKRGTEFSAAGARSHVEGSLRRLRTDHLDVLFFHSPFSAGEISDDVWGELARLQDAGKVRFVGHSVSKLADTAGMCMRWAAERRIDAVQLVLSLLNREALPLMRALSEEGIGIVARESLANGFLGGQIRADSVFPAGTAQARHSREEIAARVNAADGYRYLVQPPVRNPAQAAFRWVLSHPEIAVVLTGSRTVSEMADSLEIADMPPYDAAALARAESLHDTNFAPL